uniref:Putative secreted protein n=1 Tax=Anopheles darlingi TaxID=43151 RepID=A0A2M4DCP7_ANODA
MDCRPFRGLFHPAAAAAAAPAAAPAASFSRMNGNSLCYGCRVLRQANFGYSHIGGRVAQEKEVSHSEGIQLRN